MHGNLPAPRVGLVDFRPDGLAEHDYLLLNSEKLSLCKSDLNFTRQNSAFLTFPYLAAQILLKVLPD